MGGIVTGIVTAPLAPIRFLTAIARVLQDGLARPPVRVVELAARERFGRAVVEEHRDDGLLGEVVRMLRVDPGERHEVGDEARDIVLEMRPLGMARDRGVSKGTSMRV